MDSILKVLFFPMVLIALVMLVWVSQEAIEHIKAWWPEYQELRAKRKHNRLINGLNKGRPINHRRWE